MNSPRRLSPPFWRTGRGALFVAMILSSLWAWWMIAWPVATMANVAKHAGHFPVVYLHVVGGTGMLLCGAVNFYLAATRANWKWHRISGLTYLALGVIGSGSAIAVLLTTAHKSATDPLLTNVTVSLLTLAAGWLAFAAMG